MMARTAGGGGSSPPRGVVGLPALRSAASNPNGTGQAVGAAGGGVYNAGFGSAAVSPSNSRRRILLDGPLRMSDNGMLTPQQATPHK